MAELVDKIFQFISTIKFHDFPGLETEVPNFNAFLDFPWPVRTLCMRIKAMSLRSIFHLYLLKRSVEFASRLPCLNKNDCHADCGWLWRAQDEEVCDCLRLSRAKIQKSYTFVPTRHKVSLSAALISKLCCSRKCATFSVYFPWKHSIFVKIILKCDHGGSGPLSSCSNLRGKKFAFSKV